jgi:uncharacterized membrane protein YkvA (DUF1232 family)
MNFLKSLYKSFKKELKIYQLVLNDKRTPKIGKFFLSLAIGYFFLPFDLIPDFIPVLGHLDDALIIPLLIYIAIKLIPKEIIVECRRKVMAG